MDYKIRKVTNIMDNIMRKKNANQVMVSKFLRMAQYIRAAGAMIRLMVLDDSLYQLIKRLMYMREIGKTTKHMDKEFTTILMELITKVNG